MPANPKAGKALLRRLPMEERFGMAQCSPLFPFHRREVKNASRGLNKNIPAILNRIESAHTLNEGRSWHPHPASARRIDVKDKERVGFSVVCAKRRDMSGALLAYSLALVGDDHIVTPTLEVFNQISPNILLGLAVINDDKPGRKTICSQHLIELTDLIAEVLDLFSIDRHRFAENLRAGLQAFGDYVVLCEARDRGIVGARNVFKVF